MKKQRKNHKHNWVLANYIPEEYLFNINVWMKASSVWLCECGARKQETYEEA